MYIPREKLDEIKKEHNGVIVVDDDAAAAFGFVYAVMIAEADALKEKCSYATNTINRLEAAAHEVFSMQQEIESESFSEGG